MNPTPLFLTLFLAFLPLGQIHGDKNEEIPDLTICTVEGTEKDYLLGPTGLRGWIYHKKNKFTIEDFTPNFSTKRARQILVTDVEEGSPSHGLVQQGDVILGVGNKLFTKDPRLSLAASINHAEKTENQGQLNLLVWRKVKADHQNTLEKKSGQQISITLSLKPLGTYHHLAPFDCPKSQLLKEQCIQDIYREEINSHLSIWALALLATGEEKHLKKVKHHIESICKSVPKINHQTINKGSTWNWSYRLLLLSEYYLSTNDPTVLAAIKDYAILLSMGQSVTGTWGHYMAQPSYNEGRLHGRLEGYATLNQPSLMALMGLAMAQKCGVQHPKLISALTKARNFYAYYIDKGAIPYGYGFPKEYLLTNNGTSGSAALAFSFLEDQKGASFFSKLSGAAAHKVEIGHTGAFFNSMWTGLGANLGGPNLYSAFFKNWTPLRTLTRKWNGGYVFQRAGGGQGRYGRIGPSSAMLLHLCLPLRHLYITGKDQDASLWLNESESQFVANLRFINYQEKNIKELIQLLGEELPILRRRAAREISRRNVILIHQIKTLLQGTRHQKVGASHALGDMKEDAAPAADELMNLVRDTKEELWIRNLALVALIKIGKPSQKFIPELLKRLNSDITEDQRRHHELYLAKAITSIADEPYTKTCDKSELFSAAKKLLTHPHMRGRVEGMNLIKDLELKDLHLFSDQIIHVIKNQDPTYLTYQYDRPAKLGLNLLEKFNIEEGMELAMQTIHPRIWGQKYRISGKQGRLAFMEKYGSHAKPYIDQLKELLGSSANTTIEAISSSNVTRRLITLEEATQRPPVQSQP